MNNNFPQNSLSKKLSTKMEARKTSSKSCEATNKYQKSQKSLEFPNNRWQKRQKSHRFRSTSQRNGKQTRKMHFLKKNKMKYSSRKKKMKKK